MIQSMDTVQANATENESLWAIIWTEGPLETIKYARENLHCYVVWRQRAV